MDKLHSILLTDKQLEIIDKYLELVFRIHSGQLHNVIPGYFNNLVQNKADVNIGKGYNMFSEELDNIKEKLGLPISHLMNIRDCSENDKVAWDLHNVIRKYTNDHNIKTNNSPLTPNTYNFKYTPLSKEPLAKFETELELKLNALIKNIE